MERRAVAGEAARTRSRSSVKARFSLSVPASLPPQSQMSLKSRHRPGSAKSSAAVFASRRRLARSAAKLALEQLEKGGGQHRGLAVAATEDADFVEDGRLERPRDQAEMAKAFGRQPVDQRPAGARRHQAAQAGEKFRLDHGVELSAGRREG